ncbi:MAG: omptin family outer membrane protease [Treponema sp.]|jgi:outer membrane protease|nr:omptin family outer membrane protease [Treponema sp.]
MLFSLFPARSEPLYSVSTSASFGAFYGQIEEIVYKSGDSRDYLSQLLWDMKTLLFWSVSMNFERRTPLDGFGFFTEAVLKYGVNADSGVMEDRDWQGTHGQLTNYSCHWNYTQNALILNIDAGVSFPLFKTFVLKTYGTVLFADFSFESRDGYYQYVTSYTDTWNETIPKRSHTGPAINYKQLWFIGGIGASLTLPLDYFQINITFNASPLVFCAAHDTHRTYGGEYYDYVQNGFFLEPKAEVRFLIPRFTLAFFYSYKYAAGAFGPTYRKVNGYYFESGVAGAGFSFIEAGLTIKVMW